MFSAEKRLWEAWRERDAKKIEATIAADASFVNIFGEYFPTRKAALKNWSNSCDVKSVSLTEPMGRMLSPTVGIVTFKAKADGACYGQKIDGSIWGTSIYVKEGGAWKWTFGINVPARAAAA